jgi:O-antigen ligase
LAGVGHGRCRHLDPENHPSADTLNLSFRLLRGYALPQTTRSSDLGLRIGGLLHNGAKSVAFSPFFFFLASRSTPAHHRPPNLSQHQSLSGLLTLTTQVSFGLLALFATFLVPPGREVTLVRFSAAAGLLVGILGNFEQLGLWLPPSSGRPGATFGFRNIAAMYLAANLPLSILLLLRRTTRDFILGAFATVSMGAFLVMTRTRGAWLGVGLASAMALFVMLQTRGEGGLSLAREVWKQSSSLRRWVMPILLWPRCTLAPSRRGMRTRVCVDWTKRRPE